MKKPFKKFSKNKKSQVFMMILVVVTLLTFSILYLALNSKKNKFEKDIGDRQFSILKAQTDANKAVFYIENSARYASKEATFELIQSGGVDGSSCGEYFGYPLWNLGGQEIMNGNDLAVVNSYGLDCMPVKPDEVFSKKVNRLLNYYLIKYPGAYLPLNNYNFEIANNYIYAKAKVPIYVDIVDLDSGFSSARATDQTSQIVGDFAWPSSNPENVVTSCYGSRRVSVGSSDHQGIDLRASRGDSVFAAADGTVIVAKLDPWGEVKIKHDDKISTRYLHNSAILVKVGQTVKKGDVIARAGDTAPPSTTVPVHIHFELHENGRPIDPIDLMFKIDEFNIKFTRDSNCYYFQKENGYSYADKVNQRVIG